MKTIAGVLVLARIELIFFVDILNYRLKNLGVVPEILGFTSRSTTKTNKCLKQIVSKHTFWCECSQPINVHLKRFTKLCSVALLFLLY